VRQAADTLAVPAAALVSVDGADMVWVVRGGRATRTPVTVGVQGPDLVEVTTGLAAGDRIVVSGTDLVEAGMRLP
jgi:multidrug efflux pump subunit AcrA (membrane-fusion protein)